MNVICPGSTQGPWIEGVLVCEAELRDMTCDALYSCWITEMILKVGLGGIRRSERHRTSRTWPVFLTFKATQQVSGQMIAINGHPFSIWIVY